MKVIITTSAKSIKTPATIHFVNRLSNFRCINQVKTVVALILATNKATPTEKTPK